MGTSVREPAPRDYAKETEASLRAQIKLAPDVLKAEQATRPGYTKLDLESLDQALYGVGNQKGLLALYEDIVPRMSATDSQASSAQRASDIADLRQLGPEMRAAIQASNPEAFSLMTELEKQAQSELAAGSTLTPSMRAELEHYIRGGQSARGLGAGPSDLFEEAFTLGSAGQQLKDRRRAFAGSVVDMSQRLYGDPLLAITGRPSRATDQAGGFTSAGQSLAKGIGPLLFNPESQYAADIYQNNYQGQLAARTASAANKGALIGAGIQAAGSILGGFR